MTLNPKPISDQTWAGIRAEFTLTALQQVLRQLVRVFIDDNTFCPGFQFLPGGQLHPTVVELFQRAMELQIPHNYFTAWMVSPSRDLAGARPVDNLKGDPAPLLRALEAHRWS
ncbi:hypothetical protein [Arthrobacter sp. CG_A4]|uniref:hypothetical protein n=1 Tax=Arthrobacter sp. CG_A4 TaxID=3071706 RepID=UPI002E068157|nr:hypothetical protein [Arthrobacter sp. CG_A4]